MEVLSTIYFSINVSYSVVYNNNKILIILLKNKINLKFGIPILKSNHRQYCYQIAYSNSTRVIKLNYFDNLKKILTNTTNYLVNFLYHSIVVTSNLKD